jgi:hypothetical protein
VKEKNMKHSTAFRLSRVEAEGWNEAQRVMMDEALTADEDSISRLNPHIADPERARWHAGFRNALNAGGCR